MMKINVFLTALLGSIKMFQQIAVNFVHLDVMTVSILLFVTHVIHSISSGLTRCVMILVLIKHSRIPQHQLVIHVLHSALPVKDLQQIVLHVLQTSSLEMINSVIPFA